MPSSLRRRSPLIAAAISLAAAAAAASAAPPPLADRVPADAVVYVGWAGADHCPGYDASHLKTIIDHSSVPELFTNFVPQVVRKVAKLDADAGEVMDQMVAASGPMWQHPTAFYFGGVDYPAGGGKPTPKLALLCDAGPDANALATQVRALLAKLPPDAEPKPTVTVTGGLVTLSFTSLPAGGLATAPAFAKAMGQCRPDGAAVAAYVDMQGVVTTIDAGVRFANEPEVTKNWPKVRQSLGLDGLRQFAATSGFEGKDWVERQFAGTDGKAGGIVGAFADAKPLDADLLSVVPRTADRVSASRLDLAAGFDAIHDAIPQFDADAGHQVDDALDQVNAAAGLDVRRDLIGSLGDQWVTYADKGIGGTGIMGSVLVNRLRDPAKADSAMTQLSRRLNFLIAHELHEPKIEITFREQTLPGGVTMHYFAVPLISPTWAVRGNMLYVGLYPQVVAAAVDEAAHHSTSILQRPEYLAVMQRLGNHPAASVSFVDLPAVAPDGYADLLAATRLWLGIGDIFGAHPPALVVPPLRTMMAELAPAGTASWSDAAGWHAMAVSPFPGAEAVTGGGGGGMAGMYQQMMIISAFGQIGQARRGW